MHPSNHSSAKRIACGLLPTTAVSCLLMLGAYGVQAQSANDPSSPPARISTPVAADGVPKNRYSEQDLQAAFGRADTNQDGKLSREEAEHFPAMAQRFELIDTDRDTFISFSELARAAGS